MSDNASSEENSATETTQRDLLEQLSKLVPSGQKELFETLIAQSQFYFALTEQLQKGTANRPQQEQQLGFEKSWDIIQALFGGHSLFSQQTDIPFTASHELSRLLGLPDLEEFKKQTELLAEFTKKVEQLQDAQKKLTPFLKELNESALEQFNAEKGDTQDASTLYSLWTKCGEQAFADVSKNNLYIESQTDLLNSLTGLDSLKKKLAQSAFQQSGIASRHELEIIHRSLHDLKREFRQKSRQQEQEIVRLKKETSSLKRRLAAKPTELKK